MNPSTGTFITMDEYQGSIYDPMSLHKYLYANANPVMYCDPSGYAADGTLAGQQVVMYGMAEISKSEAIAATAALSTGILIISDLVCRYSTGYSLQTFILKEILTAEPNVISNLSENIKNKTIGENTSQINDNRDSYSVNMEHITSRHTENGNGGPNKGKFPWWMTSAAIEEAVRYVKDHGWVVKEQYDMINNVYKVMMRGIYEGHLIEIWVNVTKKIIESGYPIW